MGPTPLPGRDGDEGDHQGANGGSASHDGSWRHHHLPICRRPLSPSPLRPPGRAWFASNSPCEGGHGGGAMIYRTSRVWRGRGRDRTTRVTTRTRLTWRPCPWSRSLAHSDVGPLSGRRPRRPPSAEKEKTSPPLLNAGARTTTRASHEPRAVVQLYTYTYGFTLQGSETASNGAASLHVIRI